MRTKIAVAVSIVVILSTRGLPATQALAPDVQRLGRDILKELIETNTTHSTGSTTVAAERMAARLLAGGFPRADVVVAGDADRKGNLVARFRGKGGGRKPVLFIAHLDVVEAKKEDWSMDPFVLTEKDGYFYGRGTLDVKGGAAMLVTAFVALRQRGFVPDRDLILALTADEEGGPDNGISWLLAKRRDLIDADYCINVDTGGGELRGGKVVALEVQAAEKVYESFTLTVRNPGGHSSLPVKENAIYRLAAALMKLSAMEFPTRTNEVTRGYFAGMAKLGGPMAADMRAVSAMPTDESAAKRLSAKSAFYNALLRTTCVATMLQGGHAENALPQTARATVNCRMLPDDDPKAVQQVLVRAVADPQIEIAPTAEPTRSPPSPLVPEVFKLIDSASQPIWGAIPVMPYMETGATDGLLLRNAGMPVYGVTGIAYDPDDVRAHGKDERILVRSFEEGIDFAIRLASAIGGQPIAAASK
jgi:acetylornithine deacetylase/succinyl-diaminopimelate desuccinylase-like protein